MSIVSSNARLNPQSVKLLAYSLMLISCIISAGFYSSLGFSPMSKFLYGGMGIAISLAGASLAAAMAFLWVNNQHFWAFVSFVLIIIQYLFATQAHLGFFSETLQEKRANSEIAQSLLAEIKSSSGGNTSEISGLKTQMEEINKEITRLDIEIANCPKGFVKNCITPKTEKLNGKKLELERLRVLEAGNNAKEYNADNKVKLQQAYNESISGIGTGELNAHSLFITQSAMMDNIKPSKLQAYFLTGVSGFIELLIIVLFFVLSLLESEQVNKYRIEAGTVNRLQNDAVLNKEANFLREKNITPTESRGTVNRPNEGICKNCNSSFVKMVKWQKFCSESCKKKFNKNKGEV